MRFRYSKYTGDLLDEIDLDDLVEKLSDLLLSSGFHSPFGGMYGESEDDRTMQALHDAIMDALFNGGVLSEEALDRLMGDPADADQADARSKLEQLIQDIIDRMMEEGFITGAPDLEPEKAHRRAQGTGGEMGPDAPPSRFEVTDKSLDFLGYRALRDLLGSLGKSSLGRHDTRDHATGIETIAAPKPYEFGDSLNLDPSSTVLNAVKRSCADRASGAGTGEPFRANPGSRSASPDTPVIDIQYEDLMVSQGEYQSSCATVLMLDCSHSMILYGEDRFTPAKRVALALANLIRLQYPGDALNVVLFHDSAEEIPLRELGRVRVGPYYTNTREGLKLARRILDRQRKDMRQIIMITDGKPSALTQPDGRIYKNAFGLDPFIVSETIAEVAACRKSGIMINTFMLARDYELVAFVRRVAEICRGKAYFTTPYTLGQYVLMDYMDKKTRTIH
ncbi:MAG TPA: VWA domain-containing protein [Vicinamibacterales bacterium]|nr:VWA domain-containing protein [Vicinamibacterales bacterium]